MSYNGDTEANALFPSLVGSLNFDIPTFDFNDAQYQVPGDGTGQLYEQVTKLTTTDLTSGTIDGTGVFDTLMKAFKAHLREEYDKSRITGAEYTKAYIELTTAAMANATQFLLSKETAFWQAQAAQVQAITAKVQLQTAKVQAVGLQFEAATTQANYALTKLKLATEDANYGQAKYQIDNMLPIQAGLLAAQKAGQENENYISAYQLSTVLPNQVALTQSQKAGQDKENSVTDYQLSTTLPAQTALVNAQKTGQDNENAVSSYQLSTVLPAQVQLTNAQKTGVDNQNAIAAYQLSTVLPAQVLLNQEQMESVRAQTMDTRSNGVTPVTGTMGKQKELYARQIISYQRDSEVKMAKLFTDAWITQKTIDEGLLPPDQFNNTNLNAVLTLLRANNDLD